MFLSFVPAAAFAEPAKPAAAANTDPNSTSASYGDWVMRCLRPTGASAMTCEVAQTIQITQQGPIAQIGIGRAAKGDPLRFTVLLPSNVTFPSVVKVYDEEKSPKPLELSWKRCLPLGCVADGTPAEDQLKAFRSRAEPGKIEFVDAIGRTVQNPAVV